MVLISKSDTASSRYKGKQSTERTRGEKIDKKQRLRAWRIGANGNQIFKRKALQKQIGELDWGGDVFADSSIVSLYVRMYLCSEWLVWKREYQVFHIHDNDRNAPMSMGFLCFMMSDLRLPERHPATMQARLRELLVHLTDRY